MDLLGQVKKKSVSVPPDPDSIIFLFFIFIVFLENVSAVVHRGGCKISGSELFRVKCAVKLHQSPRFYSFY